MTFNSHEVNIKIEYQVELKNIEIIRSMRGDSVATSCNTEISNCVGPVQILQEQKGITQAKSTEGTLGSSWLTRNYQVRPNISKRK